MTDASEAYQQPSPVESLRALIHSRQEELDYLLEDFDKGLEFVHDIDRVNQVLADSPRPDLVMTARADISQVNSLSDLDDTNNFQPRLASFGIRTYAPDIRGDLSFAGYRAPDTTELGVMFQMGARGDYQGYRSFAKANGIDTDVAEDIVLLTHAAKESFLRMWIIFPELTTTIMARCLNTDRRYSDRHQEEVFVAYNLMAQLVDVGDNAVIKDGTVDGWILCR